ncbi:Pr6Pr family membrane protein [Luethyella okanaganae]|uniref:Pr6Pr family membrane protein n=1 Tax=Luethyella okanaganae TaxID=69372 RepID=A0ABW1VC22_9MICO
MRKIFGFIRIVAAAAIVTAIVGQFAKSFSMVPDPAAFAVNFFSFFTILSNTLSVVVLLIGAWYCFRTKIDPPLYNVVLACVVTYMATTGVVYNLLLRDVSLDQATTLPWSNEILHLWAPSYMVLVWIFTPGKSPLPWNRLWAIVSFPLVWSVYTMLRGPIVGWYPYPFLDPAQPGGYRAVLIYVVAIAGFIGLMGCAVIWLSHTRLVARSLA